MEAKFKSLSIFDFQTRFPDDESCLRYLSSLKWKDGFRCKKCGNDRSCKGTGAYDRQCSECNYLESPTAGTLFHKVKFPLLKASWIVYYVSTNKKGISSTELSRKLELRQMLALQTKGDEGDGLKLFCRMVSRGVTAPNFSARRFRTMRKSQTFLRVGFGRSESPNFLARHFRTIRKPQTILQEGFERFESPKLSCGDVSRGATTPNCFARRFRTIRKPQTFLRGGFGRFESLKLFLCEGFGRSESPKLFCGTLSDDPKAPNFFVRRFRTIRKPQTFLRGGFTRCDRGKLTCSAINSGNGARIKAPGSFNKKKNFPVKCGLLTNLSGVVAFYV